MRFRNVKFRYYANVGIFVIYVVSQCCLFRQKTSNVQREESYLKSNAACVIRRILVTFYVLRFLSWGEDKESLMVIPVSIFISFRPFSCVLLPTGLVKVGLVLLLFFPPYDTR